MMSMVNRSSIDHLFSILRHFMRAENHASPRAASDKHTPFYGNKIDRCVFVNYAEIDEL
jgi:hypothetical protein